MTVMVEAANDPRRGRPATGALLALVLTRKSAGKSQQEAAECCGVSQATISRWERGEDRPDRECLRRLADFYGADYGDLSRSVADFFFAKEYS